MDTLVFFNFVLSLTIFIFLLTCAFFCIKYLKSMRKNVEEILSVVNAEPLVDQYPEPVEVDLPVLESDMDAIAGLGEPDA